MQWGKGYVAGVKRLAIKKEYLGVTVCFAAPPLPYSQMHCKRKGLHCYTYTLRQQNSTSCAYFSGIVYPLLVRAIKKVGALDSKG